MAIFGKIWKNIKTQPDIWFFYGFLLTFTLSVRKVLFYFPIKGTFNEYAGIYVYISDIFLILAIIAWIISILSNTSNVLSSIKLWISTLIHNLYLYIPLLLVFLSFLSMLWSDNQPIVLFRSIKLLELYFLYLYIILRIVPPASTRGDDRSSTRGGRGTLWLLTGWNNYMLILIFVGIVQSIIAIIQFIIQRSFGLFWLKESLIGPNVPGVAKIILHGDKFIRSYGLFPHPNILGGFLLLTIILTLLSKKLFHMEQFDEYSPCLAGRWALQGEGAQRADEVDKYSTPTLWNVSRGTLLLNILLAIQLIALFLTFSKSAIIGLLIAFIYIAFVPRGTKAMPSLHEEGLKNRLCSTRLDSQKLLVDARRAWNIACFMKHARKVILTLLIFLALIIIAKPDIYSFFIKSLKERVLYLNVSRGTFLAHPVFGVGSGQFVWNMHNYPGQALEIWQFQPVHNVFLLILSELGLVGLGLFVYWIYMLFKCSTWNNTTNLLLYKEKVVPIKSGPDEVENEENKATDREVPASNYSILQNKIYYLSSYFKGILLGFVFIMLFDHYFWDIWQGQVMLWITLGLIVGLNKK